MGDNNQLPLSGQGQESGRSNVFEHLKENQKWFIAKRVAEQVGFPERLAGRWFDGRNNILEGQLRSIAQEVEADKIGSILLSGGTGTGKSSILAAMVKTLFLTWATKTNAPVHQLPTLFSSGVAYITHTAFVDKVHSEIGKDTAFMYWTVRKLFEVPLLVVDDLGSANCSEYNLSRLEELIDYRYSHKKPMWIASNFYSEDLKSWPGWQRIASRLSEKAWLIYLTIDGNDRRKDPLCV